MHTRGKPCLSGICYLLSNFIKEVISWYKRKGFLKNVKPCKRIAKIINHFGVTVKNANLSIAVFWIEIILYVEGNI